VDGEAKVTSYADQSSRHARTFETPSFYRNALLTASPCAALVADAVARTLAAATTVVPVLERDRS